MPSPSASYHPSESRLTEGSRSHAVSELSDEELMLMADEGISIQLPMESSVTGRWSCRSSMHSLLAEDDLSDLEMDMVDQDNGGLLSL